MALFAVVAAWIGISLYRIDHDVHHVGVPASLLAKGKNDLLAIVKGPNHSEQIFVFHDSGGHTNVLKIPSALGLPMPGGGTVPIRTLSLHAPATMIAGLSRLGIPVSHYVGVDLHMVDPSSSLGQLATGRLAITSLISDPTGTTGLLDAGGLAHLSRARDPGLRRPPAHARPHGQPRLGPHGQGRSRHGRARVCLHHDPAWLSVAAMRHQRGGGRLGWDRLRHALAPEHHDPEPDPVPDGETPPRGPGTRGEVGTQASLDQVLRRASRAREAPDDENT